MYPYIENPAIARAMADNERRQAESDATEAQRENHRLLFLRRTRRKRAA